MNLSVIIPFLPIFWFPLLLTSLRLVLVPWALPGLVSITFPFAFHISEFFHSLFFTCHWISFVFLLYGRRICTHSVDPSLTPGPPQMRRPVASINDTVFDEWRKTHRDRQAYLEKDTHTQTS